MVAKHFEEGGKTAKCLRGMGVDPTAMGEMVVAAIKRSNPPDGGKWVLLGDIMKLYSEVTAGISNKKDGLAIAMEMGKRTAKLLELEVPDTRPLVPLVPLVPLWPLGPLGLKWTEALGRVMRVVWKERIDARAESRKSGDIRRVAQHVGWGVEHLGKERRLQAENAVLDHRITHARMVKLVGEGKTGSLFYGPEIRDSRQTADLVVWCETMEGLVYDADYNAEVDAIDNEADYYDAETVAARKRGREEDREERCRIVGELEAEASANEETQGQVRAQRRKYDD